MQSSMHLAALVLSMTILLSHQSLQSVLSSSSSASAAFLARRASTVVLSRLSSFGPTTATTTTSRRYHTRQSSTGYYSSSAFLSNRANSNSFSSSTKRTMMTSGGNTDGSSNPGLTDIGNQSTATNKNPNNSINKQPLTWKERIDISIAKSRKIRGSNYIQISTIDYETMEPRCRTVVFRGFMKHVPLGAVKNVLLLNGNADVDDVVGVDGGDNVYDCVMKMITDLRSNKVKELEGFHNQKDKRGNNNSMEMVWWFPKSSEQYRIRGKVQFIGKDGPLFANNNSNSNSNNNNDYFIAERKQAWGNLSDPAREQFYWKDANYLGNPSDAEIPPGGRDEEGKVLPPPEAFLLMFLYPTKVDYLRLGDNYRQVDEVAWGNDNGGDGSCHWKSMQVTP